MGAGAAAGTRRRARFHELEVAEVRPLTPDSIEVSFAVPAALSRDYSYLPGQYVALRARVGDRELRRSYSLCRPPSAGRISIAIKRDLGGRFSSWAHASLKPGERIEVMSPEGRFTTALQSLDHAHVVGLAAGSGITPMMAHAHAVLGGSASSRFTLIYSNRSSLEVMFLEELAALKDRYPARLAVHHVLSREQRAAPLLSGRIDADRLTTILDVLVPPERVTEWLLCGPLDLVELCRGSLAARGVPASAIRFELFSGDRDPAVPDAGRPVPARPGEESHRIEFTLDGTSSTVETPASARETVLSAALRVRADVPFACAGGVCGTCRARLVEGTVRMAENFALEPDEIERGYVLTCQSRPTSPAVTIDYDI